MKARQYLYFVFSVILLSHIQVAAFEAQFATEYLVDFSIQQNGETQVNQQINITNLKDDVIATSYSFTIKYFEIFDVSAQANGNKATPKVETSGNETTIVVNIDDYVIGKGRQNKIELTYKTLDIATKVGEVWNINIPKTQLNNDTSSYNVTLEVKESLGPKIFISPVPDTEKSSDGNHVFNFTKESLRNTGISASFGSYQVLNFKLKYQISNPNYFYANYEVALPPDIKMLQQVKYSTITPSPNSIKLDEDGNAIATFRLKPKQKLQIELNGAARLTGRQINPAFGGKFESLPNTLIEKYTKAQKYWESDSKEIKAISNKIIDTNLNVSQNAQKAYDYVTETLSYNFDALKENFIEREGAVAAANNKKPFTCMEFTDLFVALARSMGIPAREINGYAINSGETTKPVSIQLKNGDLLHSWAEYYDPFYGWVQVDPTWGNTSGIDYFTKLDTNHLAFVVKGIDSEYPYPAGSYRFSDEGKLVEVDYALQGSQTPFDTSLEFKKSLSLNLIKIINGNQKYEVENSGETFVYDIDKTGLNLAPKQKATIWINNTVKGVSYKDYEDKESFWPL
ncbi:hypothetical protein A3K34_02775 [candidate division WWE3 bacterium RIFOXYC1_FULL_40_10]|uniref:Transglutaminase-like domain-containing protein n=1 Tax=candidate division WWE3 bacterium RIFOXYA2_FULL_46_9 TaxID=1802636 RepID=A0A1F4W402_UNCKA|nr:MAG: hypothetical protein A3K58_02775 [candidate division WWE3 bacterium RIFOXYB1_FULL_40_22]OGC61770.1 MAG: hypothetical protein A3K37_02775 [candidate division WWE3 bacterium RIFOXYA1_FULL_40_11]OGC63753.1 MAG: hypothetical protein A2264_05265 [candidate division WWE3 bacterium RIFOXYA2_FULL_46_9]OGC66153.1 MAG: hypothetical protein A3K34_02775 [candidate division WWE3 bacterium RIFOXYC1_FULL_40_10]OGC67549.1 MAG: hypothetical protein A2450_03665 [candidate division WWE3 bacterium RIFOXYC2